MRTNTWIALALIAALVLIVGASWKDIPQNAGAQARLQAAITKETVEGDLKGAIELYQELAESGDHAVAAKALVRMGHCFEKLGNAEASKAYERVVREFGDQKESAAVARARLAVLARVPSPATGIAIRQVWTGPWYGAMGAPSRDGTYLTFRTESEDLAIRDLATGKIRQLTRHEGVRESAWSSVPSPDGKQVAYSWNKEGLWELRLVGVDRTEPRVLYSHQAGVSAWPADWTPDGRSILTIFWNRKGPGGQIALVAAEDRSVRVLKDFKERAPDQCARISPDGRYVVYDRPQDEDSMKHDIFVLDLEGDREIPLIEHQDNDIFPDWSPDGHGILFFSNRTGSMGAWWIQVAGGEPQGPPRLIKPDLRLDYGMGFTNNGAYYYGVHTEMNDVYVAEIDMATGRLISTPKAATERFVGSNSKSDWSPDGGELLFLSKRGEGYWGARALCVRSTESGEVRELISKLDRVPVARWSPDGSSLLGMAMHPTEGIGLYRIDVHSGDFVAGPELGPGAMGWLPALAREGKALVYQASFKEPQRFCVIARDLETGKDRELYGVEDPAHFASRLTLSPDGRQLAFVIAGDKGSASQAIKVMPVEGGAARDLLRGLQIPFCEAPIAWTPDGLSIIFLRQPDLRDPKTELWLVPVPEGEPRKLDLAEEGMVDICLHPDGRRIAFTEVKNRDEIWILENILTAPQAAKK